MKLFRSSFGCIRLVPALAAGVFGLSIAAQNAPAQAETVLSFNLAARVTAHTSSGAARPTRSASVKVLTRAGRVRVETRLGGTPVVGLYAPPYLYRLLPGSKSGTRYRLENKGDADLQALLRNPSSLRSTLLKNGAKKIGNATLHGQPVEGFASSNYRGRGEKIKVWLRRRGGLPLQLDWSDKSTQVRASWSNYNRLSDSAATRALFVAPSGYKIRDTSQPNALVPGLM